MDEQILNGLREIESLSFDTPRKAKEFLRALKAEKPELYQALKLKHEESQKPKTLNGCLLGERSWSIKVDSKGIRLYSSQGNTTWPPYEALEARCLKTTHVAPTDGCDCGLYAILPGRDPWFNSGLYGTITLWGKFIEGSERVYKAQYGYPKSFDLAICHSCHKKRPFGECVANLKFEGRDELVTFICKTHLRTEGPLRNLYVPATYIVDELHKEYGIEQSEDTVESFIEGLNLEGF